MKVIYGILNKLNGKQYVGSTNNYYKRKQLHLKRLATNVHHSYHLQNSWNKHGEKMFDFIILEKVDQQIDLIEREQWWIDNSNSNYNICRIAGSSLGVKRTEATKEKIRQRNLGLKHPDWRNKIKSIAQGGENHWTKNKKFSENAKKNMSNAQKELFKNGYKHPRLGLKETKEQIEKKRIRASKIVLQFDLNGEFIKEYKSAKEASSYGFIASSISQCIMNKRKTHKNFIWKLKN